MAVNNELDETPWTLEFTPDSQARRPIKLVRSILGDLWSGRSLAGRLFIRNLAGSYRQSLLGFLWILVPTIAQAISWTFLAEQNIISSSRVPGDSFLAFIAMGSVLWQAFFDALQAPLRTTQTNQGLITKLNFPRESLVLVAMAEVLFDFVVRMVCILILCAFLGIEWTSFTLVVPIFALGLIVIGTALGLMLTPFGILYQDVSRTLAILGPFWMLMTPVVYVAPETSIYRIWYWLNPPAALLSAARDLLCVGTTTGWTAAFVWLGLSLPLLLLGLIWFRLGFRIFIERMAN